MRLSAFARNLSAPPRLRGYNLKIPIIDSDLSQSSFDHCDLTKTKFENTNLEKVDFRTSNNYTIDTELNKIKKAQFSLSAVIGLLDKYDLVIK